MNDPYEILGITRDATDDEINTAYRNLIKQYHPDKHIGNPLADLAKEKITEINAAYDAVMDERKKGTNTSSQTASFTNEDINTNEIRILINQNRLNEAEVLLNNASVRNAEWHFLMGSILKKRGWYDMAYQHFERASNMEPTNQEYSNARDNMDYSGAGYRGMGDSGGYNGDCCNICQTLICVDCCCEMCGGNMIPCIGCR